MNEKQNSVQNYPLIFERVHFEKLICRGKKNYREALFDRLNVFIKPKKSYNTLKRWFLNPNLAPQDEQTLKFMNECLGRTIEDQYNEFTKNSKNVAIIESYNQMEKSIKIFRNEK